jgi:hypothetical protein
MAAKKPSVSQVKSNSSRPASAWYTGMMGTAILCLVLAGIFIACAYAAWQKVGPRILASPEYYVGPQQLEITPQPEWIRRTDLREDIYQYLSRQEPLRIMDDDLIERVADAFSRHPWVAKVKQVSKHHPARVKVDLIYRKPVCMVEISGGLLPVDIEGTILPKDDFSPVEAAKYPRLIRVDRSPMGSVGTRWGDSRVAGGAQIANELLPLWEKLKLQGIVPISPAENLTGGAASAGTARRFGEYNYIIMTLGGMRIFWGHAPAENFPGEIPAQQKVKKLEQFYAEHGSLDYPQGPRELDLQR